MWRLGPVLPLALLAACQFSRPKDIDPVDAQLIDAVDAPPPCTPSTIVCDDAAGVYTECDATGTIVRQLTCPLGCASDTEQCLDIDPHNGLAMYLDMVENPPDVVLSGATVIDSLQGVIFQDGLSVAIPTFLSPAGQRVFVVASLEIRGSVDSIRPGAAIAFVSQADVTITGTIDVSANGSLPGPGGAAPASAESDCTWFDFTGTANFAGAGGAGGFYPGGTGGETPGAPATPGGPARPLDQPLLGGCAGGTYFANGTEIAAQGGAGGGMIQLVSRTLIGLYGNATIDASGGGAATRVRTRPGAGGGAGGTILLEAPQVVLDGGGVVLSTKGGGGSGASSTSADGGPGEDGGLTAAPAMGGASPVQAIGGRGGTDMPPTGGGFAQSSSANGGGGGGSAGFTVTFTSAGTIQPRNGATIRSPQSHARLVTRKTP